MANVSRNVPPWAAVITIMPAVGGPSRTTFHSSSEKAACVVISGSCAPGVPGHVEDLAVPGRAPHPARVKVPGHDRIEGRLPSAAECPDLYVVTRQRRKSRGRAGGSLRGPAKNLVALRDVLPRQPPSSPGRVRGRRLTMRAWPRFRAVPVELDPVRGRSGYLPRARRCINIQPVQLSAGP